jgi:hypothetical protein
MTSAGVDTVVATKPEAHEANAWVATPSGITPEAITACLAWNREFPRLDYARREQ